MAKVRTAEQEAIRAARRRPEKTQFLSRRMAWANCTWPGKWGFWTNYNEVSFNAGTPRDKFYGSEVPAAALTVNFQIWPPRAIIFWQRKRLLWIGEKEWKKELRASSKRPQ